MTNDAQPSKQILAEAQNDTPPAEGTPESSLPDSDDFSHAPNDGAGEEADDEAIADADGHGTDAAVVQTVPHNKGTVIGVQNISEIHRLRGTPLPKDWLNRQLQFYIPRDEATKAIDALLDAHRVAVIHAQAGTGRYTTALHVFTSRNMKAIRQVRREPNEKVDLEGLQDEDTGWILDLRDEEETLRTGFGLHLREVESHLRTTRSFLVLVTHTDTWTRVADEAAELAHPLTPPAALEVFRARLARREPCIDDLSNWLGEEKINKHLSGAVPAEAVYWADTIEAAVALNRSTTDPKPFHELVEFVVQSAQNWRRKLCEWHTDNTDSAHRNYLLAAAVLDGAPVETVYEAHSTLGTALDDRPQPTKGQQGPGIIQLTDIIGAELGADDRIRFLKPGYAEAAVEYFWVDRPHHVADFTRWTAEQATTLPRDLGIPLADRVTQWATRYTLTKQSFTILRTIATHWAGTQHLRGHAQDLLVAAAVDPTTGKRTREQYLAWAKDPDTADLTDRKHTPTVLKQALAGALAQLGSVYPKIALKRLSELAANTTDPDVTDAVGDALMDLWDQQGLQETIRTTLTSWFNASQHHYTDAARRAFLHLAGRTTPDGAPVLLAEGGAKPAPWTLSGWRCALDGKLSRNLQDAVNSWLDAALIGLDLRPVVLKTFSEAVFRSEDDRTYLAPRFLLLNHAVYGWEPAHAGQQPTERTYLRDSIVTALREADPTTPALLHHVPTTA
ncbi:hypothetical protein [Streptomyces lydicus]|uniref:hypothetical protein n=1 Tax=Streptomyces lydicus TaxID=47763 RepID=UPI0037B15A5D